MKKTSPTAPQPFSLKSICAHCLTPINLTGVGRYDTATWHHDHGDQYEMHAATPELRISIDATCPGCQYPEIGYAPARQQYVCSRCGHTQTERPAA